MLIRYFDGNLRDIPEELAVAILADPSANEELSEYTSHWVNVIIHGVLSTLFDENKTFEENVNSAITEFQEAPEARQNQAAQLVRLYNMEVKDEDIGMFPASDLI